jgi:hypothetical protein
MQSEKTALGYCVTKIFLLQKLLFRKHALAHLDLTIEKRLNTYMELLREKSIKLNLK